MELKKSVKFKFVLRRGGGGGTCYNNRHHNVALAVNIHHNTHHSVTSEVITKWQITLSNMKYLLNNT